MKVKNKIAVFIITVLSVVTCLSVGGVAYARQSACGVAGFNDPLVCGYGSGANEVALQNRVKNILNTIYLWIGIIAVIVIVIGGIRYIISTGDSNKIASAKGAIMYAIIGLIVVLAAFAITNLVIGAIDGQAPSGGGSGGEAPSMPRPSNKEEWQVSAVSLSKRTVVLEIGDTETLKAEVYPKNAVDTSITWSSDNKKVATVDQNGKITAKSSGKATISATSRNGISDKASVTVNEPEKEESKETPSTPTEPSSGSASVKLSVGSDSIMDEHTTVASVTGNKGVVRWSSSNNAVMIVDTNGKITGKKPGTATLMAKTLDGKNKSVTLTKKITVREIKILWVGNSKTYVEDIDKKAVEMLKGRGYSISSTRVTKGGQSLKWNYTYQGANIKKYYDYAVLQERTGSAHSESQFYEGALKISEALKAKNSDVRVYIRKVWFKRDSSSSDISKADTIAMNVAKKIAINAGVFSDTTNDGAALYSLKAKGYKAFADVRHQSKIGAYTAAACIVSKMFNIDPTTITYIPGDFSSTQKSSLSTLRSIAKDKCYNQ